MGQEMSGAVDDVLETKALTRLTTEIIPLEDVEFWQISLGLLNHSTFAHIRGFIEESVTAMLSSGRKKNLRNMVAVVSHYLDYVTPESPCTDWLLSLLVITRLLLVHIIGTCEYNQRLEWLAFAIDEEDKVVQSRTRHIDSKSRVNANIQDPIEMEGDNYEFWAGLPTAELVHGEDVGMRFIQVLMNLLTRTSARSVQRNSLELHVEVTHTLIGLMSSQIYGPLVPEYENPMLTRILMPEKYSTLSKQETQLMCETIIGTLLSNYSWQALLNSDYLHLGEVSLSRPPSTPGNTATLHHVVAAQEDHKNEEGSGFFHQLTRGVVWLMKTPFEYLSYWFGLDSTSDQLKRLSQLSNLLFLLLVHQRPYRHKGNTNEGDAYVEMPNAFRNVIVAFADEGDGLMVDRKMITGQQNSVSFSASYESIVQSLPDEQGILLLYTLLHANEGFQEFVFAKSNVDALIVPLVQMIYESENDLSHNKVYMAVIDLLILSQDPSFARNLFDRVRLDDVPWYTESKLKDISVGNVVMNVLVRALKLAVLEPNRDAYLETNCLAILSNLASYAKNISNTAASNMVALLQILSKRLSLLSPAPVAVTEEGKTKKIGKRERKAREHQAQQYQEVVELTRLFLEIVNAALITAPLKTSQNYILLYWLLYRRDLLVALDKQIHFADLLEPMFIMVNHFAAVIEAKLTEANIISPDTEQIIAVMKSEGASWTQQPLKTETSNTFNYEEQEASEEFFIPYLWSICHSLNMFQWPVENIVLFEAHQMVHEDDEFTHPDQAYDEKQPQGDEIV